LTGGPDGLLPLGTGLLRHFWGLNLSDTTNAFELPGSSSSCTRRYVRIRIRAWIRAYLLSRLLEYVLNLVPNVIRGLGCLVAI
jgi:hypothetical protein